MNKQCTCSEQITCTFCDLRNNNISNLNIIGKGTFGLVYKATLLRQHRESKVALKIYTTSDDIVDKIREISALTCLRHQHIIGLVCVIACYENPIIVMNQMESDLDTFLKRDFQACFAIKDKLLDELMSGICCCHSNGFMHRDLKPSNLLLTRVNNGDMTLKIADFGQSVIYVPEKCYTLACGTMWYRPPDLLLGNDKYSYDVDMWAIGCIYMEMYYGVPLFPGEDVGDMLRKILQVVDAPDREWILQNNFEDCEDIHRQLFIPEQVRDLLVCDPKKRRRFITNHAKKRAYCCIYSDISKQPELDSSMRFHMLKWLFHVAQINECSSYTFHKAVGILDKVLQQQVVSKDDFCVIGMSCLSLAVKMHETFSLSEHECAKRCDIQQDYFLKKQVELAMCLKYRFSEITCMDIIQNDKDCVGNSTAYLLADICLFYMNCTNVRHLANNICNITKYIDGKHGKMTKNKTTKQIFYCLSCFFKKANSDSPVHKKYKHEILTLKKHMHLFFQ